MNISKALQIDGWMSLHELQFLAKLASKYKLLLEVGSYKGRSARAIADNTYGILYCVDPWKGVYYNPDNTICGIKTEQYEFFASNLEDHIRSGTVRPIKMRYEDYNPEFKFEFIFLDGDHRYETVVSDIDKSLKLLNDKGGIIGGHDYGRPDWPGVKKAVDEIFGSKVKGYDTIWYVEFK